MGRSASDASAFLLSVPGCRRIRSISVLNIVSVGPAGDDALHDWSEIDMQESMLYFGVFPLLTCTPLKRREVSRISVRGYSEVDTDENGCARSSDVVYRLTCLTYTPMVTS